MDTDPKKPEIIEVITLNDGWSAKQKQYMGESKIYRIQEIMLGVGAHRRAVPYTKKFLAPQIQYKAEVLPNGKLRIVG